MLRRSRPQAHAEPPEYAPPAPVRRRGRIRRALRRAVFWALLGVIVIFAALRVVNPPTSWTIIAASRSTPIAPRHWVPLEEISPAMLRAVIAAEDANFCSHWGFDVAAIRAVIASGGRGGASTISQQVVKNVFLWQGRSWSRKAVEATLTPLAEAFWTKRRILEFYLNLAEFGPGIFGIDAAARQHFGTIPARIDRVQAARLASVLPAPRFRRPDHATPRSRAIAEGAALIARDGRDACVLGAD